MILLVGMGSKSIKKIRNNIIAIPKTNGIQELATYYSLADVFVNPTWSDNFPTTNLEALACGTPVVTYDTGGSIEAADRHSGRIVRQGDLIELSETVREVAEIGKQHFSEACRMRAEEFFNMNDRYNDYLNLYEKNILTNLS